MILDTSFIVDVIRGSPPALNLREELEGGSEAIRVPTPVLYELWEGIERSRYPPREIEAVEETLRSYPILDLKPDHAKRAGQISGALARRGLRMGDADILIAGMGVVEGETVLTRNAKDFERVPELTVRTY